MNIRFEGRATLAVALLSVACGGSGNSGSVPGGAGGAGGSGGTGGGVYQRGPDPTITTGVDHTCTVTPDGALYCWGTNAFGQVGDGTFEHRSTPTRVGSDSDWVSVRSASEHTCARKTTGAAYCWG